MEWDEPRAAAKAAFTLGEDLSAVSIAELQARLDALRAEMQRIEIALEAKRRQKQAAASIFKS